jgi:peptidoglycan/LPS O-acetylase OafA/YrhL
VSRTRRGRIGIRRALAGFALLALFAIQLIVEQVRTGDIPDNFILFALGFLLVSVGQLLFAPDLRPTIGRAWALPLVAVAGLLVALTGGDHPIHDVGLFVFEAAWVALGVALLRANRRKPHGMSPADEPAT